MTLFELIGMGVSVGSVAGTGLAAHMAQRSKIDKQGVKIENLEKTVSKLEDVQEAHNNKIQENFTTLMETMNDGFKDLRQLFYETKNK